ncbi:MAG: hypothetical protein Q9226_007522 [Calogaya cf. arnoldii]
MAPATDTALGVNEIVSAILAFLPQKDLKTARQVSKRWASLGGQMLIGTLYISPREMDMIAFEDITKHQDLAKSVKHLVYDSAQFYNFDSAASYYAELYEAHVRGAYLHLGNAHAAIDEFNELVHCGGERKEWSPINSILPEQPQCRERFNQNICQQSFIEGFLRYSLHFKERGNIILQSWFDKAVRGLRSIGPLDVVDVRNTWNDIYEMDEKNYLYQDLHIDRDSQSGRRDYQCMRSEQPLSIYDAFMKYVNLCEVSKGPISAKSMRSTPDAVGLLENGLSDGGWELVKIVEMLHATGQKPLRVELLRDIETMSGFPTVLFSTGGCLNGEAFLGLADNIRALHLDFDSHCLDPVVGDLRFLIQFLRKAIKLQVLDLVFPLPKTAPLVTETFESYRLDHIFNPIREWIRPTLIRLDLVDVSAGYNDLSRLLFSNLPSLQHLHIHRMSLRDGIWEDIVEGLRQVVSLEYCNLGSFLLHSNGKQYPSNDDATSRDEIDSFLETNENYILYGGIHPRYPLYVPSQEFKEKIAYWKQLRSEFKEAQDSGWGSHSPWSLHLPSRIH